MSSSTLASAVGGGSHCISAEPLPPPPVDIRLQVWAKPMADGTVAAVAFNRSPAPLQANLSWAVLGLPPGRSARARDLWLHADIGVFADGALNVTVQPHDVFAVRLALV